VGFLSIPILVYDRLHLNQSTDFLSVLYVILASLSYVIGGAIIQKLKKYDIEHISLISMFYGTLILTPFIIYELLKLDLNSVHPTSIYSLIYLGVVSTAIAFLIRSRLIYQHGLIFMSQVSFLVPLFGVYFSWLFLNETLSINMIISLIITILGLYVLQKGYSKIKS
jgi:drug/metabolite transporter (DMT)-like permease